MSALREALARAAACGSADDAAGCRAALAEALPFLAPVPAARTDPQLATDQCQAARMALLAGDEPLALELATLLLRQVAGPLQASTLEELIVAHYYAWAFVPFYQAGPWLERRKTTGLPAFLAQVALTVRPALDEAGWSGWAYPEAVATALREQSARLAVGLGRYLLEQQPDTGIQDAFAFGTAALEMLGDAGGKRSAMLVASDAHNLIGRALFASGDPMSTGSKMLAAFEESLALQERVGTPSDVAVDQSNLGGLLSELATIDTEEAKAEEARARRALAEDRQDVRTRAAAAAAAARDRAAVKLARARQLLDAANDFYARQPDKTSIGVLVNRAAVEAGLGDWAAARADLVAARALAASLEEDATRILLQRGRLEFDAGDLPAAEAALNDALPGAALLVRDERFMLDGTLGAVLERLGRPAEAFVHLSRVFAGMRDAGAATTGTHTRIALFKRFRWIVEALIACSAQLGQDHAALAFEAAEYLRWAVFVAATSIGAVPWRGPPNPLVEEEVALLGAISGALLGPMEGPAAPEVVAATTRLDHIWTALAVQDPEYVAIRRGRHLAAEEVAAMLDDEVGSLVAYYVGEEIPDLAVAWVFRRDGPGPAMIKLPFGAERAAAMVDQLRAATQASDARPFEDAAAQLHAALVAPLATSLPPSGGICFAPYGALHNVPFGALRPDDGGFLVERRAVVVAPSATALRWCRRQGGERALRHSLIVAATGAARLGGETASELSLFAALARDRLMPLLPAPALVPKEQATRTRLLASLAEGADGAAWDIVHIACHGLFETLTADGALAAEGLGARLVLTGADTDPDRDLTALEIAASVRLRGAVVVLSACESAITASATNDELFGLGHAFLFAGASSVLASLWYVVQWQGVELTRSFYSHLLDARRPASRLSAMWQAQLATMREKAWFGLRERSVPPSVWAAFQLMGDWR